LASEGHPLRHQSRDKRNIARKPIQLRNNDAALFFPGRCENCRKLRAPIERISALPGLEVAIFGRDQQGLSRSKSLNLRPVAPLYRAPNAAGPELKP
jgi:hypothetical protein